MRRWRRWKGSPVSCRTPSSRSRAAADEIEALLLKVNANRCEKPASPDEIRRIAESVCKYPPAEVPAEWGGEDEKGKRGPSHASRLVTLAEAAELFHTPGADPELYATIPVGERWETWRLRSPAFRRWLVQR